MNTQSKARSLIATVVALSLAGSGNVWADRSSGHNSGSYGHGGHQNKHHSYNKHYKNKHNRHGYSGGYGGYYGGGYGGSYYKYRDDHGTEKLLGGLLIGGLVGYALGNSKQRDHHGYDSYPQSSTRRQAQLAVHATHQGSAASCLQEREYQTTVIVGGREVDAYGTACLQPDGSWSRSAAKLASF